VHRYPRPWNLAHFAHLAPFRETTLTSSKSAVAIRVYPSGTVGTLCRDGELTKLK
jgi:hypothetical protein